jgi:hypothetical protein
MSEPVFESPRSFAVQRCLLAWHEAYDANFAKYQDEDDAGDAAAGAFRDHMPDLTGGEDAITDFVACVAQGMLVGAIDPSEGSKLLYAAQVANGLRKNKRPEAKQEVRAAA